MKRSQIAEKYKWDLSKYALNEKDYLSRVENLRKYVQIFATFEGKLGDDDKLLKFLDLESECSMELEKLANYAARKLDEDLSSSKSTENLDRLSKLSTDLSIVTSFATPEVSKFSKDKLEKLAKNPKFKAHKLFFKEILRQKPHILPKSEEKLLSGMSEFLCGFSNNFDSFSDADMKLEPVTDSKGKAHKMTHALYSTYMHSPDRVLRANAFKEENGAYGRYMNFLASNYLSEVKADCYFAKIRGYNSALEQAIFDEEASVSVYNSLIENVHKHLDLMYKFYEQKRKLLGLDKFYIYDQFAPVTRHGNKKYSYDEAIELVKQAVAPLGEEYVNLIQKAKDEKWIDVMPNDNKIGGAYSASSYGANPVVLTNFTGDYNSVSTLAHELGHAMHSYYSQKNQIFEESEYVIFVAEVASTVNEMLLRFYGLNHTKSHAEKLSIIDDIMTDVKSTIYRQTMFAEFEAWAHSECEKGRPLSKEKLCQKYNDLNKLYFGKKVILTTQTQFEWARIPHFYRAFYVYKYATGLICALNIASRILSGEEGAVEKYMAFLSAGCTKDPISLLKDAGCDLENSQTFDKVFALLEKLLKEYK